MQKYSDTILNNQGRPVAGAIVKVTTYPGNNAATIYATDGGPAVPFVLSGLDGRFSFYAADGHYNLLIAGIGIAPITITDIVLNDPNDDAQSVATVINFGAKGDGVTDDTAAIQRALDYMGTTGGGTVLLSKAGRYRITSGLKLPSFVTLEGVSPVFYPYNDTALASSLILDFPDVNQWAIEPKTTSGGSVVPYNMLLNAGLPSGATYNCGVRNLLLSAKNTIPYGAIRMHGCPGALVENVGIVGTATGLLVNECYGARFNAHTLTRHYGVIAWGEVNACSFDVYCTRDGGAGTVPGAYQFPPMATLSASMVGLGLSTNAHATRAFGFVIGSDAGQTSCTNDIAVTSEFFNGGIFMHYSKATNFARMHIEGRAGEVSFGIVAVASNFVASAVHPFMSGTGTLTDFGGQLKADLAVTGVLSYAAWGAAPPLDGDSFVTVRGVQQAGAGIPTSLNIACVSDTSYWNAPTLGSSWANAGAPNAVAGYRKNGRTGLVELKGYITGGTIGGTAFVLPPGFRPQEKRNIISLSSPNLGYLIVLATGEVIPAAPTSSANGISLDNISFAAEQ